MNVMGNLIFINYSAQIVSKCKKESKKELMILPPWPTLSLLASGSLY